MVSKETRLVKMHKAMAYDETPLANIQIFTKQNRPLHLAGTAPLQRARADSRRPPTRDVTYPYRLCSPL